MSIKKRIVCFWEEKRLLLHWILKLTQLKKNLTTTIVCCLLAIGLIEAQPNIQWQKSYGGNSNDFANCIQQTTDGGYIVVGYSSSNNGDVTGNHGGLDFWVLKINSLGVIQWQKSFGGTDDESASKVKQTTDGGYIVAGYSLSNDGNVTGHHGSVGIEDYWIIKIDSIGSLQWQKSLGGSYDDEAFSIQQTSDGGYIVGGESLSNNGNVTGNHGSNTDDYWLVKLNSSGIIQWQKCFGGTTFDEGYSIQQTTDGGYIFFGLADSNDGNVTGHHGTIAYTDYWIVKTNSAGSIQWQKSFGGTLNDEGIYVEQTSDGGYILGGYSNSTNGDVTGNHGGYDMWVVKIDSVGTMQWQKTLGGTLNEQLSSIHQTCDGGYIVSGYSYSNNGDVTGHYGTTTTNDYWVVKLNDNGNIQWQHSYGGTFDDFASYIEQTTDGGYIIAGYSKSNDGDVTGHNGTTATSDYWVIKLEGHIIPVITSSGSGLLCTGDSVILTSSLANSYYWSTGDTTQNITVFSSGNYYIATVDSSYCPSLPYNINVIPDSSSFSQTSCDYFISNGQTFTTSGIYIQNLTNSLGCDSTLTFHLTINQSSNFTLQQTACDSLVLNGQTYTSSGIYIQNLTNSLGCDSILTLNLSLLTSSHYSYSDSACNTYLFNGLSYNQSGVYTQILTAANGCDSVISLHLTVMTHPVITQPLPICMCSGIQTIAANVTGGTWSGLGIIGPTSGEFDACIAGIGVHQIIYSMGSLCFADTVSVTVLPAVNSTINAVAPICFGSPAFNLTAATPGGVWTGAGITNGINGTFNPAIAGTHLITYTISSPCLSYDTMNIIVHPTSTSTITTSACNQLAFGPIIYTTPGTYTHTFTSVFGCDSTVTINLVSIFHVNDSVTQNGNLLTAHQSFAGYQWVNCSNGYALIAGATNQSYTATANGSYAVIIYKNGCIDTSNCYTVTNIGIDEYTNSNGITITPNPFTSQTTITFSEAQKNTTIKITDVLGNVIQQLTTNNRQLTLDMSGFAKGIYFVRITDENKNVVNRKIILN